MTRFGISMKKLVECYIDTMVLFFTGFLFVLVHNNVVDGSPLSRVSIL